MLLLAFPAVAQDAASADDQAPVFRTGTAWVRVDVQAGERGRVLGKLQREDFVIYDEDRPQKILYFGRETEPLDVLLLLDVSGSMGRYLEQMAANARDALKQLLEGDRVAVMEFSRRSRVEEEFTADRTRVMAELRNAVHEEGLGSGTRINAAVLSAAGYIREATTQAEAAKAGPRPGRRAVLIVTDNNSMDYHMPDEKAIAALLEADTVLNAIVVGRGEPVKLPKPGQYLNPDFTRSDVFHIAEETGGEAVKANRADASFRDMIESIRTRYSIQYAAPEAATAGSFRHIRVELAPDARRRYPNAWIRARTGYVVK